MDQRKQTMRWWLRLLAPAVGVMMVFVGAAGCAESTEPVTDWIGHNASPLSTVDPSAPLDDLALLRRSIAGAEVVGLGESTHGAAEEITLKHRTLRLLVEQMGFRSIAWEENWTTGRLVNDYIRSGAGDLDALMSQMSPQWQSRQVADVLRWLHDYNANRADKVQFVGVEYYLTGSPAYDAVDAYVARIAPARLPELRDHLQVIRPKATNIYDHIQWYMGVADKEPYIRHARQILDLVNGLLHEPGDRHHVLTLQDARQIVAFYEHYNLPDDEGLVFRDVHAAQNLRWWREFSGDKIAYWGASAHTANAPELRITTPPDPDMRFPSAGSYLHRWYGDRYVSIGFTFTRGTVSLGEGSTVSMPAPAEDWFESRFGKIGLQQFTLDLRTPALPSIRRWLDAPITTRGLPDRGPGSHMDGGSLAQWFDVIVHRQEVTPALPA